MRGVPVSSRTRGQRLDPPRWRMTGGPTRRDEAPLSMPCSMLVRVRSEGACRRLRPVDAPLVVLVQVRAPLFAVGRGTLTEAIEQRAALLPARLADLPLDDPFAHVLVHLVGEGVGAPAHLARWPLLGWRRGFGDRRALGWRSGLLAAA